MAASPSSGPSAGQWGDGHRASAATAAAAAGLALAAALAVRWRLRRRPAAFKLEDVVRPSVLRAKAYHFPPRYQYGSPILLDANENPHGPPLDDPSVRRLALERYPDPRYEGLRAAVADLRGVDPEEVFLGNGSDEVIDMLIRVFCQPGRDAVIVCPPTYAMYEVFATFNEVSVVQVDLNAGDFTLRPSAVIGAMTRRTKLVFLCSPGNPTARLLARDDVEAVLAAATGAVVVVDEAYIDFADADGRASAVPLLRSGRHPNLVVMQTLSKAWGLAGARVGIALAPRAIVQMLNKVRSPFNISSLAEDVAVRALAAGSRLPGKVPASVHTILAERGRVMKELSAMGPKVRRVFHSDANFVLLQVDNARAVCDAVASQSNVVVRYRGAMPHCRDCVRVTIGTAEENTRFLAALRSALA